MEIDKNYAKYETQHSLLDGVFAPTRKVKDGDLRIRRIKNSYNYKDPKTGNVYEKAVKLELVIPYLLNPQAESVLLALIKLSSMTGIHDWVEIEATQPNLPALFKSIEGDAKGKPMVYVQTNQHKLLREAGMDTGKEGYRLLEQYLKYMSEITVHYENTVDRFKANVHLLETAEDTTTGNIVVRLNWRLTGAIIGSYQYAMIDLDERRLLKKDASKTLHRWLSAWLKTSKPSFMLYETLASHIWTEKATKKTQQKRIERLKREILPEIAKLDKWTIEMGERGAQITRHKAPDELP